MRDARSRPVAAVSVREGVARKRNPRKKTREMTGGKVRHGNPGKKWMSCDRSRHGACGRGLGPLTRTHFSAPRGQLSTENTERRIRNADLPIFAPTGRVWLHLTFGHDAGRTPLNGPIKSSPPSCPCAMPLYRRCTPRCVVRRIDDDSDADSWHRALAKQHRPRDRRLQGRIRAGQDRDEDGRSGASGARRWELARSASRRAQRQGDSAML